MKNTLARKALPHVIAIVIFLLTALLFCKPALEGLVLDQHDIVGWKGMAQNAFDYKEKHGHFPLWNTALFSGMPNYLIAMEGDSILPDLTRILSLGLPQPVNMFFLAALCFYILCMAWGARPVIGILGALAYAFATYNPIIIAAGHITKMFAIAYMPLLLAGMILVYTKRYWLGLAVATLGAYLLLNANHPQISYYFMLVAGAVTLAYLFQWIRSKDWKHTGIALGLMAIAAIAGALTTSLSLLTTSEYSKYTMRGGKTVEIVGDSVTTTKTSGLDTAYAFSYSLGPGEYLTSFMPGAFGGNSQKAFDADSKIADALVKKNVPPNVAAQISASVPRFWGDPNSSGGGPFYSGALVVLLALLAFLLYKHPLRWALLGITIIAVMMAMGKYLPSFNIFLFENLPLYNKFRAPSITMVIPQLVLPFAAVIGASLLLFRDNAAAELQKDFRKILYLFGGFFAVLALMYLMMDYRSPMDANFSNYLSSQGAQPDMISAVMSALKSERQAMIGGQILRTLFIAAILLGVIWFSSRQLLKPWLAGAILALVVLVDLMIVDQPYLNEEKYVPAEQMEMQFTRKTPIDEQILADKEPQYRIYNAGAERFSASDYHFPTFHRTIGGYHPAKLRIYQDILERYLYTNADSRQVLNMLNTRYVIVQNPQNGQQSVVPNAEAYGPAWLVSHIQTVPDQAAELQALATTNLRDTLVVQQSLAASLGTPGTDSAASIQLTHFGNDTLVYQFSSSAPQVAVFSEIYYPAGWNAYVDGQKTDYVKADYALRAMALPAGQHEVKFVFEPEAYEKGNTYSLIGSILVLLLTLGGFGMAWWQRRNQADTPR